MKTNYIECGDCAMLLKNLPDESIDLVVTSPPYDTMRTYDGFNFDFETIAKELYRATKDGGVVVWIVGDETIDGSETGTSFRQALYFKEIGFNIHDTMIWNKGGFTATGTLQVRYASVFEYMFVFSKGKPKAFNPIKDRKNISYGGIISGTIRQKDGTTKRMSSQGKPSMEYGQRFNIWEISPSGKNETDHPAVFPLQIARDHIKSWSNVGDIVLDPFLGSGTTAIASILEHRKYIGFEISERYFGMAKKRIEDQERQIDLFDVLQETKRGEEQ